MNLSKTIKTLINKRDRTVKKNVVVGLLIYFFLFLVIDYLGVANLNGQNIFRRCINMVRRLDPLSYRKILQPFCQKYEKILDRHDILRLQSIKIPHTKDIGFFTRLNTTTHQCCDNYSDDEIEIMNDITEKIRKKYEEKVGKQLYSMGKNGTIYRYHGNNSQHLWHVDPYNVPEIYNFILCIKRKGEISPLQCKNQDGDEYSIYFDEGDGAMFNGGTTVHQVPPNEDPDSERTVLSVAFTSKKELSEQNVALNLCTYIEGGNNYVNIIKILFGLFAINYILTQLSGINALSYKFLITFFVIILFLAKYIPYYFDLGIGTERSSSISYNIAILCAIMIATVSTKGAIVFFSYFLISDLIYPKSWVFYH